jgi:deoxyribonuclease V
MTMKTNGIHSFRVNPEQAIRIQRRLRGKVITKGKASRINFAAGVDVSFQGEKATCAVAVIDMRNLLLCDHAVAIRPIEFPYIPGLLAFREIPVILDALKKISKAPDVIMCDGQGIAHPRRLGLASHLGVLTGMRTIGVAKSRLTGAHGDVPLCKGEYVPLIDKNETIGAVLRTRYAVKPLYISIGHRIDLVSAIEVVMRCTASYRLPETTRWAHRLAVNWQNDRIEAHGANV